MSPLAHSIYQRTSDNVAASAVITVQSGTPDASYPPSLLVDGNPARVAKIGDVAGAWLLTFPAPQPAEILGLIHHTFDDDQVIRIQGSNDAGETWTDPPFDAVIPIPPALGIGATRWPQNPWLDLTQQDDYTADGWQYYRLSVEAGSQNIQLGQLWLGQQIRRLNPDVRWGVTRTATKPTVQHVTSYGVRTIYSRGTTLWRCEADLWEDVALKDALDQQWFMGDGGALPWLFIPDGDVNGCYLVRWASDDLARSYDYPTVFGRKLAIQEVARGLRPGV